MEQFIKPLEEFRREHIGNVKVGLFVNQEENRLIDWLIGRSLVPLVDWLICRSFVPSIDWLICRSLVWLIVRSIDWLIDWLFKLFFQAEKKKFDKESTKFYQSQEKHLSMSCKKDDNTLKEADADLQLQRRHFIQASLRYVKAIQEVHERKKFEFVETVRSSSSSNILLPLMPKKSDVFCLAALEFHEQLDEFLQNKQVQLKDLHSSHLFLQHW